MTHIQQTQSGCVAEEATSVCLAIVKHSGPRCPRNHLFSDVECIFWFLQMVACFSAWVCLQLGALISCR